MDTEITKDGTVYRSTTSKPVHVCSQEGVLATMSNQLKNIESDIADIKQGQMMFMVGLREREVNAAKYPDPEFVNKSIAKIDRHDTYFKIIGAALLAAWGFLLFLFDKIWVK